MKVSWVSGTVLGVDPNEGQIRRMLRWGTACVLVEVDLSHSLAPTTRLTIRLMAFSVLVQFRAAFCLAGLERSFDVGACGQALYSVGVLSRSLIAP